MMQTKTKKNTKKLRIIPLGGLEEVGRNMTVFEYGNDIIIVDMGLQFPEEDMPGIDYIIPNIKYLKGKERNIRGVLITHGHMDHIGAIPHLMPRLGNPPMFTAALTAGIIKKKQEDYPNTGLLNIKVVNFEERDIKILQCQEKNINECIYTSRAEEFILSVISVDSKKNYTSTAVRSAEILLCTDGQATIKYFDNDKDISLKKGKSVIVPASVRVYNIQGKAVFYKASVNIADSS